MPSPLPQGFAHWAILEIMGHQRFAGFVQEQEIAGAAMLRLDVPAIGALPAFTRYFSAASVYSITPVAEELARNVAQKLEQQPVSIYDLPESLRLKLREQVAAITHRSPDLNDFIDQDDDDDQPY